MLQRFKFRTRLLIVILITSLAWFAGTTLVVGVKTWNMAERETLARASEIAGRHANRVQSFLESGTATVLGLSETLDAISSGTHAERRPLANEILRHTLDRHPQMLGIWTCWEPDAFDGRDAEWKNTPGHDATGRFIPYWYRQNDAIATAPITGHETNPDWYALPRKTGKTVIMEPFLYPVSGKEIRMTSIIEPILRNGRFVGVVGTDIVIDEFARIVAGMGTPMKGMRFFLMTGKGNFVVPPSDIPAENSDRCSLPTFWPP